MNMMIKALMRTSNPSGRHREGKSPAESFPGRPTAENPLWAGFWNIPAAVKLCRTGIL